MGQAQWAAAAMPALGSGSFHQGGSFFPGPGSDSTGRPHMSLSVSPELSCSTYNGKMNSNQIYLVYNHYLKKHSNCIIFKYVHWNDLIQFNIMHFVKCLWQIRIARYNHNSIITSNKTSSLLISHIQAVFIFSLSSWNVFFLLVCLNQNPNKVHAMLWSICLVILL